MKTTKELVQELASLAIEKSNVSLLITQDIVKITASFPVKCENTKYGLRPSSYDASVYLGLADTEKQLQAAIERVKTLWVIKRRNGI